MKYVFITLLIINSIAFILKGWLYYIFVLASIVAFLCVAKVNNRQSIFYIIASALSGAAGIVFALAYFNGRIFMLGLTLFIFFLVLAVMAMEYKPKQKANSPAPNPAIEKPKHTFHRYKIDTVISEDNRLKNFFAIVQEYYSGDYYECDEYPDYGVFPYYKYRRLPCRLEVSDMNYYRVYIETEKDCWEYIGVLFRSSVLEESLSKAEYYRVDVSGGTYHVVSGSKKTKEWMPLEFTLVICLRNE